MRDKLIDKWINGKPGTCLHHYCYGWALKRSIIQKDRIKWIERLRGNYWRDL